MGTCIVSPCREVPRWKEMRKSRVEADDRRKWWWKPFLISSQRERFCWKFLLKKIKFLSLKLPTTISFHSKLSYSDLVDLLIRNSGTNSLLNKSSKIRRINRSSRSRSLLIDEKIFARSYFNGAKETLFHVYVQEGIEPVSFWSRVCHFRY